MREEIGVFFAMGVVLAIAVWMQSTKRNGMVAAPVGAGGITPTVPTSNSPEIDGGSWSGTPYYLRANYPVTRGGGNVLPSLVMAPVPFAFGMQDLNPQL